MNDAKSNGKPMCQVSDTRHGIVYRCFKPEGHEHTRGDEEHVAQAQEYMHAAPDWKALFESVLPTLEWAMSNQHLIGPTRTESVKRALIRSYMARLP